MVGGRGKLIPFLKSGLINDSYMNLKFESEDVFYLKLPMNNNKKKASSIKPYEKILLDWYICNGRQSKYEGYSTAKAVIQAALNKNVYLKTLDSVGDKKRFKFATDEEADEKKKMLRDRAAKNGNRELSLSPNPPSVASSGFYEEGDEMIAYNEEPNNDQMVLNMDLHEEEMRIYDHVSKMDFKETDLLDQWLENNPVQDQWLEDNHVLDQWLEDNKDTNHQAKVEEIKRDLKESSKNFIDQASENKVNDEALNITSFTALVQQTAPESLLNQVSELKPSPVVASKPVQNQQWHCIGKQEVGAILMLIYAKKDIETGNEIKQEGSIELDIPNDVLEPGKFYAMERFFQIDKYCFCFLLPSDMKFI